MVYSLRSKNADLTINDQLGARLSSILINGTELLHPGNVSDDPLSGGCFPMVPYAGRVRSGTLCFKGESFELPLTLEPHAGHGTVFEQPWSVVDYSSQEIVMQCDLGRYWPFGGSVTHRIELKDSQVRLELCLTAGSEDMPAQVGWHPWFRKPTNTTLSFSSMLIRDEAGIATTRHVNAEASQVDDCFIHPQSPLQLTIEGIEIELSSDCSHWVVYDLHQNAFCVEPQSGAPNEINDKPFVLSPFTSLSRWFTIAWAGRLD